MNSDNPFLVAPRPVRLTSSLSTRSFTQPSAVRLFSAPTPPGQRKKLGDEGSNDLDGDRNIFNSSPEESGTSDKEFDPRTSSRASLPAEALEEFLAILRPSFFPPSTSRSRRTSSVPTFSYHTLKTLVHTKADPPLVEEADRSGEGSSDNSPVMTIEDSGDGDTLIVDGFSTRWFTTSTGHLSSPISRMHTRNPFQRHPSYDVGVGVFPSTRSSPSTPCSPSTVPLPPPTPSELIEAN